MKPCMYIKKTQKNYNANEKKEKDSEATLNKFIEQVPQTQNIQEPL